MKRGMGPIIKYQMEWQQKAGRRGAPKREGSGDDGSGNREIFIGLEQKVGVEVCRIPKFGIRERGYE